MSGDAYEETFRLRRQTAADYLDEIEAGLGIDRSRCLGLRRLQLGPGLGALPVASTMSVVELIISVGQMNAPRMEAIRDRCEALGIKLPRMRFNIHGLRPTPMSVRRPAWTSG